jgi:hypothetical protein
LQDHEAYPAHEDGGMQVDQPLGLRMSGKQGAEISAPEAGDRDAGP